MGILGVIVAVLLLAFCMGTSIEDKIHHSEQVAADQPVPADASPVPVSGAEPPAVFNSEKSIATNLPAPSLQPAAPDLNSH